MRLINADSLKKTLIDWISDHWTDAFTGDDAGSEFADMIDHAKTIEQSPVVHAHWIRITRSTNEYWKCSNCNGYFTLPIPKYRGVYMRYCGTCGAKMDEEEGK